jgi:hypothetical protein
VQVDKKGDDYTLYTSNLPVTLKSYLPEADRVKISFRSPTPEGYFYMGRNHTFVEELCRFLLNNSLISEQKINPARSAVIKSKDVKRKTTVLLLRARNVVKSRVKHNQIIAEEMIAWGYRGSPDDKDYLESEEAAAILFKAKPTQNLTQESQGSFLENELK